MGTMWDGELRWRRLSHPAFLASVGLLLLNDALLKSRFPGWWTGKLSDFAGVAMVAIVCSVLLDSRVAVLVTAIGFTALKVVPGVAEAAAPLLGGVTRRDATDLLALAALVPTWCWLQHDGRDSQVKPPGRRRFASAVSSITPLVGILVAVVATTGTSCGPRPAVVEIRTEGTSVFARIDQGFDDPAWASSGDGGKTWSPSEAPTGVPVAEADHDYFADDAPRGPDEVCLNSNDCFRLVNRRLIVHRGESGQSSTEFSLSEAEFGAISTGCAGQDRGVLGSIGAVEGSTPPTVVASMGADGAVIRQADGSWSRVVVVRAHPKSRTSDVLFAVSALAAAFGIIAIRRRYRDSTWAIIAMAVSCVFVSIPFLGLLSLSHDDPPPGIFVLLLAPYALILATGLLLVRGESRRLESVAPHPDLPPPPSPPGWWDEQRR